MREALRLLCLSFVGLVVAARVAAPMVVARQAADVVEGSCEVFDLSTKSPLYDLPTTLTVMPLKAGWRLDVTVRQTEGAAMCVRLEDKQTRLRVVVLLGGCDEGDVTDYNYMNVPVPPGTWTSLGVDAKGHAVIVSTMDGTSISVVTQGQPLQRDGTQVKLTRAENVEAAVGCRTNCPGYRHASPGSDKKTVESWTAEREKFYFLPGNEFVRLQYEVGCTTTLGSKMFLHVEEITVDSQKPQWHVVLLEHHSGLATVSLDHSAHKNKTLPGGCTFSEHTIMVVGDSLFSFMCNPLSGGMEESSNMEGVEKLQAGTNFSGLSIGIITALAIVLAIVVVAVGLMHLKEDGQQRQKQKEQQQLEDYLLEELYPWCNKAEKRKEILQKLNKVKQKK